ncbi:MAG: type II toxin-antitoxin system YafQ family toxin [Spirochaetota bacterium]
MQINHSAEFKRAYKDRIQKNPQLKELFWEANDIFEQNPYDSALRTHRLSGPLEGKYAFSVDHDCRVVFHFINENHVVFLDIGSHDQVY